MGTWGTEDDTRLSLTITGQEDRTYDALDVVSFEAVEGVLTTTPDEDAYREPGCNCTGSRS